MRYPCQVLQYDLQVPEVIYQIGKDNHIEFMPEDKIMRIRDHEVQMGVFCGRPPDHVARKIQSDAQRWLQGGQQISMAAANLQYLQSLSRLEPIIVTKQTMVKP